MDYRFIEISNGYVFIFGYHGVIKTIENLRDGVISEGICELILLIGPYMDNGLTVVIYDSQENKFIRIDEEKLDIF